MSNKPWPPADFHIGQSEHLHALGVIIASHNMLEFSLLCLFIRFTKMAPAIAQRIFVNLNNHQRIVILQEAIKSEYDPAVRSSVARFLAAYEVLTDTRNFLAHSHTILNVPDQEHLTFGKGSKKEPGKFSFAHLKIGDLRSIADQIREFWKFGMEVDTFILARKMGGSLQFPNFPEPKIVTPKLPPLPPLPERLPSQPHGLPTKAE